jgi:hypothetical protein
VPGVPGPAALAGRIPLPTLRRPPIVAGPRSFAGVRGLWVPNFGDSRNDFPGHANPFAGLVPRHGVGDHPEEWCQRAGVDQLVLQAAPQAFDENVVRARPLPSMLMEMPRFFSGTRKSGDVNWDP